MGGASGMTERGLDHSSGMMGREVDMARDCIVWMKPIMSVRTSLSVWSFGGVGVLQKSIGSSLSSDILMIGV